MKPIRATLVASECFSGMHTVDLKNPDSQFIARIVEGDDENACYRCACLLAEMVGIDLEG